MPSGFHHLTRPCVTHSFIRHLLLAPASRPFTARASASDVRSTLYTTTVHPLDPPTPTPLRVPRIVRLLEPYKAQTQLCNAHNGGAQDEHRRGVPPNREREQVPKDEWGDECRSDRLDDRDGSEQSTGFCLRWNQGQSQRVESWASGCTTSDDHRTDNVACHRWTGCESCPAAKFDKHADSDGHQVQQGWLGSGQCDFMSGRAGSRRRCVSLQGI